MIFPNVSWFEKGFLKDYPEKSSMIFTTTSRNYFRFKKARTEFTCVICDAHHKPGMRYIGDSFCKICMKCSPYYMKNTVDGFKEFILQIKKNMKTQEQKNSAWTKDALVGSLINNKIIK